MWGVTASSPRLLITSPHSLPSTAAGVIDAGQRPSPSSSERDRVSRTGIRAPGEAFIRSIWGGGK
jgi:hypothetical protein